MATVVDQHNIVHSAVEYKINGVWLHGDLAIPPKATGIAIFAHGSGSGRHSPRNQFVAEKIHESGKATLLFDLLSEHEEEIDQYTAQYRFQISMLAERLAKVTLEALKAPELQDFKLGYFGASTGAAAAMIAAVQLQDKVKAVVSRGGRPDLAYPILSDVKAPTLLIVGGNDTEVLELNEEAAARMLCPRLVTIIPGATHLFEEPGALEDVARLAVDWFAEYLK
jgi:pimeloyl-ACP methyl ester carboxylesterase